MFLIFHHEYFRVTSSFAVWTLKRVLIVQRDGGRSEDVDHSFTSESDGVPITRFSAADW
jgi:hypothetical protein